MDPRHAFDPTRQPLSFKIYTDLEPIPLPLDKAPLGVSALSAISADAPVEGMELVPDIGKLASILHYSAGITKKIAYPWGESFFRAAACTGSLYHIELYVVCGGLPGLESGVYHYEPHRTALTRLRAGDHRRILVDATGVEPEVARAPAVLVYTDVFWRNACKYQAREYRHAFWDSGTILAHTLAMASAHALPAKVVTGFVDDAVGRLLDLDARREAAVALVPVGRSHEMVPGPSPGLGPLSLETAPISDHQTEFPAILEMHQASSLTQGEDVTAWRRGRLDRAPLAPAGRLFPLRPHDDAEASAEPLEAVIRRRGSTRRFSQEGITFAQLSTVLDRALGSVPADFLEEGAGALYDAYVIVNAVEGLAPGSYVFHRDRQALELLEEGQFRLAAGHLGLDQALPADASANIFLMSDLGPILERLGNRGYRAAQLDASIAAGRVYLAAYTHWLGATGLTFYDDAVTEFFSPHAAGKSVMFLVALGKRVRRKM